MYVECTVHGCWVIETLKNGAHCAPKSANLKICGDNTLWQQGVGCYIA